ncbi:MAG: DegT/DnrJ/EryC1/StrS family aminotransferase [Chloroflexota bacterium]
MQILTKRKIDISKPEIGDEEKQAVMEVLDSGMLVQGEKVKQFEEDFADYCGVDHAIATSNGTTALSVALMAHDIHAGDEVIIPSFTFMATATSVLSVGAIPVFVDIEPDTFSITPDAIEAVITDKTRAVMPVHLYGHPAYVKEIAELCKKYNLVLIEDSAQAHGAAVDGKRVGSFGTGCFSFYPSKNMTTGEGGIVTTNDETVAAKARMARNHGMNTRYLHESIGFNYRMTNISAAIGIEQLKKLPRWTQQRIANASYLSENIKTVKVPTVRDGCEHVFHQYTVVTPDGINRDDAVQYLNDNGIGARVYYPTPIHMQPIMTAFVSDDLDLPVTEDLRHRVFSLPVHPALKQADLEYIVAYVNQL